MNISNFRQKIDNLKGRQDQIQADLARTEKQIEQLQSAIVESEQAQLIIQHVAKQTQEQLSFRISAPVTAALAGVFDDPYEFQLRFETRRNQTEADLIFLRNGNEIKDLSFVGGGGAVDVAAFGLQMAAWSMAGSRNFMLMDEPLKWLKSKDKIYEQRGAEMIQEIAHELGLQILLISHIPEQQKGSDRVFRYVKNNEGITEMEGTNGRKGKI